MVDSDKRDCKRFKQDLISAWERCSPRPRTLFRIAIEETEAWLLGDPTAVRAAYPKAKMKIINFYAQDSVCGTWELLADAVHPDGAPVLKSLGYPAVGMAKKQWAETIGAHMDPERNESASFQAFRSGLLRICKEGRPQKRARS
ncbi:MAG: hypothetical protein R2729_08805 [Bryobacteraceae bacterium]